MQMASWRNISPTRSSAQAYINAEEGSPPYLGATDAMFWWLSNGGSKACMLQYSKHSR